MLSTTTTKSINIQEWQESYNQGDASMAKKEVEEALKLNPNLSKEERKRLGRLRPNGASKTRSRKKAKQAQAVKEAGPNRTITGRKNRLNAAGQVQKPPYIAPSDMPQWQVDLVIAGIICGGRLRNRHKNMYCMLEPVPNQVALGRPKPHRCKWHGGNVPSHLLLTPEMRNKWVKHGIYADCLLPGEEEEYKGILDTGTNSLDYEIAITKIRLRRAIKAERDQHQAKSIGENEAAMELTSVEYTEETEVNPLTQQPNARRKTERKLVDYGRAIHSVVLELGKLFQQKAILQGEDMSQEERARKAREALAEARQSITTKAITDE